MALLPEMDTGLGLGLGLGLEWPMGMGAGRAVGAVGTGRAGRPDDEAEWGQTQAVATEIGAVDGIEVGIEAEAEVNLVAETTLGACGASSSLEDRLREAKAAHRAAVIEDATQQLVLDTAAAVVADYHLGSMGLVPESGGGKTSMSAKAVVITSLSTPLSRSSAASARLLLPAFARRDRTHCSAKSSSSTSPTSDSRSMTSVLTSSG